MKIEEYRSGVYQLLGDFPTVKELKKLKKMISIMIEEQNDYYDEIDANMKWEDQVNHQDMIKDVIRKTSKR